MAQKTYEEIFWISIAVMISITVFLYLVSRLIGTTIGTPKSKYHREAIREQQLMLVNINYTSTDEELERYEDEYLDFYKKYQRLVEDELLTYLTGQLSAAICNRRAKLNHKYIFS